MMSTKGPTHNCAQFPTIVVGKEQIYRVAPCSPPWSSSLFFLFLFFFLHGTWQASSKDTFETKKTCIFIEKNQTVNDLMPVTKTPD